MALFRGRVRSGPEAAEGPHLGAPRADPGGDRDRRQQARLAGRADRGQGRAAAPARLPGAPQARRGDKRKGFTEAGYARLLDDAHQQLGGPLVLVWDNLNTHVSAVMRDLMAARDWLTVFRLPSYASELNPVESVWALLKRSLLNLVKHTLAELTALIKTRLRRMQYRPALLEAFLARARLDLTHLSNPRN
jgi:putative transposase